ncbi:MAG: methyltransferase domain-containing protein [Nitrospirae bacterium]|nr:methyltransferase domain-containing protein [Nitrospirota bacterium]MBU6479297.1 methyltransferase domain-containing protein [Nitrospirota bacterium]MDE3217800.1 methyltransferase domain-containing protein [Nitrospirota bacterium]
MGLWHRLAQQFRQPTGILGRLAGVFFRINLEGIDWTISLLEIQPTDHVLEIGFGPGHGIQQVARIATQGRVAGVDFSEAMFQQASRRNAAAITVGRVELCLGDASALLYPDNTFHKIFATNVVYLWKDPLVNLQELRRVMKPGGRLALYVIAKEDLLKFKVTQTGVYQLYTGDDLVRLLTQAGFRPARFVTKAERHRIGICALAEK